MADNIQFTTNLMVYSSLNELDALGKQLMAAAAKALKNAYAPYSEFRVGAALMLENGEVVIGNNQENAAYPSGLCAERVAFFSAGANFPDVKIVAVAVMASSDKFEVKEPVSPCGACRQVMAEYESKQQELIPIYFGGDSGPIYKANAVGDLLPFKFNGTFLKKI
jgi:cytidine deaminase